MEGSMYGSGIYSDTVSLTVECECGNDWEQDFNTDDYGNVEDTVKCPSCNTEFNFEREGEDINQPDPDYNPWDDN
jgi:hypothetical protein